MKHLWKIWILVASVLTAAYFLAPDSPLTKLVLYNGTALLSVLAVLFGIWRNKPQHRAPWLWFAAGLSSFLIADIIYYLIEMTTNAEPPFPSPADAFYLAMYPAVMIGLTKLLRDASKERDNTSFIDAAIVGIATGAALWILYVYSMFKSGDHSFLALGTQMGYPIMDLAIVTIAARLLVTVQLKYPPLTLILAAVFSLSIADVSYGYANAHDSFTTGSYIDFFWLAFYVLFGAAALHPALSQPFTRTNIVRKRLEGRQIIVLVIATTGVRVIDMKWGNDDTRLVSVAGTTMMFLLILARVYDLTRALERSRDQMKHEATHDSLTGLPNRARFAELTEEALQRVPPAPLHVLFIDLDDFKNVNDSLGHQAGDWMLVEVARRLALSVRPTDTIARLGGDEFAVLLLSAMDQAETADICERIIREVSDPIEIDSRHVNTSCSVGVASRLGGETDVDSLLRDADIAMYHSKRNGKGKVEFFDSGMHQDASERLDLLDELKHALQHDELQVLYRPVADLMSDRISHVESSVVWHNPLRGTLRADEFMPLADNGILGYEINSWVLRESCRSAGEWKAIDEYRDVAVSVSMSNLHVRNVKTSDILTGITQLMSPHHMQIDELIIRVSEAMLATGGPDLAQKLSELSNYGVRIAIDDFGNGGASLDLLRSLPFEFAEIDPTLLHELGSDTSADALFGAVVNLCVALGSTAVAKNVDLDHEADAARELGCTLAQGDFVCKALPGDELIGFLKDRAALHSMDSKKLSEV